MIEAVTPWDKDLPTIAEQEDREAEWLLAHLQDPVATATTDAPKFLPMPGWQAVTVTVGGVQATWLVPEALGQVFPILLDSRGCVDLTDVLARQKRWEFPDYPVISADEFETLISTPAARRDMDRSWSYRDDSDPMLSNIDLIRIAGGIFGKALTRQSCHLILAHHGRLAVSYSVWQDLDLPDMTTTVEQAEVDANLAIRELGRSSDNCQATLRDPRATDEDKAAAKVLSAEARADHEAAHNLWCVAQRAELEEQNRFEETLAAEVRRMIRCASEKVLIDDPWKAALVH